MRFVLGLLAAFFAMSSAPAQAITYLQFTVHGIGSTFDGYDQMGVPIWYMGNYDVVLTAEIQDDGSATCGYWPGSACRISGNSIYARGPDPLRSGYSPLSLVINFDRALTSWPTTNYGFVSASATDRNGRYLDFWAKSLEVRALSQGGFGGDLYYTRTVPEAATWAMMIVGLAAVGVSLRRRQLQASVA